MTSVSCEVGRGLQGSVRSMTGVSQGLAGGHSASKRPGFGARARQSPLALHQRAIIICRALRKPNLAKMAHASSTISLDPVGFWRTLPAVHVFGRRRLEGRYPLPTERFAFSSSPGESTTIEARLKWVMCVFVWPPSRSAWGNYQATGATAATQRAHIGLSPGHQMNCCKLRAPTLSIQLAWICLAWVRPVGARPTAGSLAGRFVGAFVPCHTPRRPIHCSFSPPTGCSF